MGLASYLNPHASKNVRNIQDVIRDSARLDIPIGVDEPTLKTGGYDDIVKNHCQTPFTRFQAVTSSGGANSGSV